MKDVYAEHRPHEGLTYDEYRSQWNDRKDRSPSPEMDADERRMLHYLRYNWKRQEGVHDAYEVSDDLRAVLDGLDEEQMWMVVTEPWCGDSAFLLPVIATAAEACDKVTLRILLRDDNLDVMDQYLTGGSRSIPKLVAFAAEGDEEGEERFVWGPRPKGAAERFEELRKIQIILVQQIQQLISYYEDQSGWKEVDTELAAAVRNAESMPATG